MNGAGRSRSWRITRTQSGRWIVERTVVGESGETREMSAIYSSRKEAEESIRRAMRAESQRQRGG